MKSLPGFRDFYPDAMALRRFIFDRWRDAARRHGFREYDGPPLEPLELYTRKSGEEIVAQLYHFTDKGDRGVALRPELTPTLARMVAARHRDYKKPIKWFAIPQLFRYERQQRGRLREHFQFNADIIGEASETADAELIALAISALESLGLTADDFVVRLSDRRSWHRCLAGCGLAEDQHDAALAAIDKLERVPPEKTREHLAAAGLDAAGIERVLAFAAKTSADEDAPELAQLLNRLGTRARFCQVDFKIVRGLAYYTGIVWEIHDRQGELRAIAGGGRYDRLLEQLGGVDLPALGFGMGDVVIGELMKARGLVPSLEPVLDVYLVIADETLRGPATDLAQELRRAGLAVDYPLAVTKVTKQFQAADSGGARLVAVIGPDEWSAGEVTLKTLATGVQERVKVADLAATVGRLLAARPEQTTSES